MIAQENLKESLRALESHIEIAIKAASLCRSASGKLGPGLDPDIVLESLKSLWHRLEAAVYRQEGGNSDEAKSQQQSLIASAKRFSGQLFVLPMSINLNNEINAKYVDVILEYGLVRTSFEAQMFNGKCSRILLQTHATDLPKLTLIYKERFWLRNRAKRSLGEARTVKISYSTGQECFVVTVLFREREQDVGQATFFVEWYPKIQ